MPAFEPDTTAPNPHCIWHDAVEGWPCGGHQADWSAHAAAPNLRDPAANRVRLSSSHVYSISSLYSIMPAQLHPILAPQCTASAQRTTWQLAPPSSGHPSICHHSSSPCRRCHRHTGGQYRPNRAPCPLYVVWPYDAGHAVVCPPTLSSACTTCRQETGDVYAIDLGGTNFRVMHVRLGTGLSEVVRENKGTQGCSLMRKWWCISLGAPGMLQHHQHLPLAQQW